MRPTLDQYLMSLALLASYRTTCIRRGVGCVLADAKGRVLSIGYNGVPSGMPHCIDDCKCEGWELPSGRDNCLAIHAEQNALLQCLDSDKIAVAYVTLSPCKPCAKLLMNTGCRKIVVGTEHSDLWAQEQWQKLGREWQVLGVTGF